jgi:large conductance mechanosensitive channel
MSLLSEFKAFISKGDVLDLAVAFVMGAAFNALITAMVTDIVTPIIGIPGHVNLASITYAINGSTFLLGSFVNAVIGFLAICVAVFFFIIKPVSKLQALGKPKVPPAPNTKDCPYCLSNVPLKATRCPFCTSTLK